MEEVHAESEVGAATPCRVDIWRLLNEVVCPRAEPHPAFGGYIVEVSPGGCTPSAQDRFTVRRDYSGGHASNSCRCS